MKSLLSGCVVAAIGITLMIPYSVSAVTQSPIVKNDLKEIIVILILR